MRILGIETSCDETAAAVVENGTKIISSVVATSSEMHAKTGGIIPEQAARQQVRSIIPVITQALRSAAQNPKFEVRNAKQIQNTKFKIQKNSPITNHHSPFTNIDAFAVTIGPGLIGSLLVGVETAKTLSYLWDKPIVPVNHLVAHIYANWIGKNSKIPKLQVSKQITSSKFKIQNINHQSQYTNHKPPAFPALALVVSGGHTDLVLMQDHGKLKWIGGTRDDAAGEAFDKCARLLGLKYPGGPAIAVEAAKFEVRSSKSELKMFPRPLIDEENYDFSFSGLKTAVLRKVKEQESKRVKQKIKTKQLAAEIQEAIVDCLVEKSIKAIKEFKPKSFLLSGGVAANKRLREKFEGRTNTEILQDFHVPNPNLCTDNAAVIAACAFFNNHRVDWQKINANPQLTIMGEV